MSLFICLCCYPEAKLTPLVGNQKSYMVQPLNVGNSNMSNISTLSIQTTTATSVLPNVQPKKVLTSSIVPTTEQALLTPAFLPTKTSDVGLHNKTPAAASVDTGNIKEEVITCKKPSSNIVKCITAQIVQTSQGPRIMLQGLQKGDLFSQEQLQAIQHQVKQQLLKSELMFVLFCSCKIIKF